MGSKLAGGFVLRRQQGSKRRESFAMDHAMMCTVCETTQGIGKGRQERRLARQGRICTSSIQLKSTKFKKGLHLFCIPLLNRSRL